MFTRKNAFVCLALLVLSSASLAHGGDGEGDCVKQKVPGHGLLVGDWWRWANEIPGYENPLLDTTGEFAHVGQEGPIWYLAGTSFDTRYTDPVVRTVTVPAGKLLFFPILNIMFFNCPDENYRVGEMRQSIAWLMDLANTLELTIDDTTLGFEELVEHRAISGVFDFTVPEDWIFGEGSGICNLPTHPVGTRVAPCVADGYWIVVPPLPPGEHVIHLRGGWEIPEVWSFETEVTYLLTIE